MAHAEILSDKANADQIGAPEIDFPIIGVGASAGGLEAVTAMFHNIEKGTGMAFVLVLHLDPNHESLMAELLGRKTNIKVRQISNGDGVEVDCLHVIPPGYSLRISEGTFHLETFAEPRGLRRPIDSFFASLAETQKNLAACVVLSGTGGDGSNGLRAVKEFGGICAVQKPEEARYDGMPFSALSTNMIDFTLTAEEIVPRLKVFFDGTFKPEFPEDADDFERVLLEICRILERANGHDFSGYKRSTLFRRLERRLQVLEYTQVSQYVKFLQSDPAEQLALFHDFLINVTSFFRDKEQFEALENLVLVPSIDKLEPTDELRIWVPGCSSGQEAYSIAMLVDDICRATGHRPLVQIFATDLDESMIAQARQAVYPASVFREIPERFRERYTFGLDGKFEIAKSIREMVRFSVHNIIQDAPFSKIDLITCRNLMIYLGDQLQSELLPLMHFSLRPGGHLLLGNSESVTRRSDLFAPLEPKTRLFRRVDSAARAHVNLPLGNTQARSLPQKMPETQDFPGHRSRDASNALIFEEYAPPFIRIAQDGTIIDSSGDLSLFLMSRPGDERNISALARHDVRDVITPLLSEVFATKTRQALKNIEVSSQFGVQTCDIIVHPLKDETVAVIFLVKGRLDPVIDEFAIPPRSRDKQLADLQDELRGTRLLLRSKLEEIETANEELKSSNEEMMSMNEELQSANEELTTSNEELKNKIDELTLANADLDTFVHSSDLAMIVLDRSMHIRHVTAAAQRIVPVARTDRGRMLSELNITLNGIDFFKEITNVIETGEPFSGVSSGGDSEGAKTLFVRAVPYYFVDGSIEGTTITFVDMTQETRLRQELAFESEQLKLAMRAGRMGMVEFSTDAKEMVADAVLAEQLDLDGPGQVPLEYVLQKIRADLRGDLETALAAAIEDGAEYEVTFCVPRKDGTLRWIRHRGFPVQGADGARRIVGPTIDVTAQEHREMLIGEMSHRVKNLFAVISSLLQLAPKATDETKRFSDDMTARIASLGYAYDLARRNGDLRSIDMGDLIHKILDPHITSQAVQMAGPDLTIGSNAINALTLVIHELTTNAVKYGCFSVGGGRLDLGWQVQDAAKVVLSWREVIPDFEPHEDKPGFGSQVIQMGLLQLNGSVQHELTAEGMQITIEIDEKKLTH